ncbi:hypothetical protein HOLleu_29738 [Holothuria leucospilota]|uniref:Reverse transcriptase domain-containing protein n=1 Tax=Holothuria leucospilota TaxID=206669 RepID=A0A9Q1BJM0_HOLLE|nr:hypothetical protein HOLleu_29738 [Holothuria leucospilota]
METLGVFARPEDVGVNVEYVNPSFLVKKSNDSFRLVTAFTDVGRYSKPQPSLMPDVDSTLRKVSQWQYIIKTDLTSAFYQIPLAKSSMKYCGVATPFRGVRVYTRSAMGMPGSETALEELMCRVLGDLLVEGQVTKITDDLYCGGNSIDEVVETWRKVLSALANSNLRFSPYKTVICPKTTTILGWIWSNGTLSASPHRIAALASSSPPKTVREMRSFLGAYKVLSRALPMCSPTLAPLENAVSGLDSKDPFQWSDDLVAAFARAQAHLQSSKTITIPRPSDQLWIVTDASASKFSLAATLYVTRNATLHLSGFFSAKLRGKQPTWLPCEIEALAIGAAVKHFGPYIIQSLHHPIVLTDSKPCVQAYEKLCRGEFSASPRVTSFLSTVSRYHATVRHLAGRVNIPSDFASRNAPECTHPTCQICSFVGLSCDMTVLKTSVQEVISGNARLPFTSRPAWKAIQSECSEMRRTHAHLSQGTRPSKRNTNFRDVKRYLQISRISNDGLLVVCINNPLLQRQELIVIPRHAIYALLTALHVQFDHPSKHQLHTLVRRYFYALDFDKAIETITSSCHHCASLQRSPLVSPEQTCGDAPLGVGLNFAADILKRSRQCVLVFVNVLPPTLAPASYHHMNRVAPTRRSPGCCPH